MCPGGVAKSRGWVQHLVVTGNQYIITMKSRATFPGSFAREHTGKVLSMKRTTDQTARTLVPACASRAACVFGVYISTKTYEAQSFSFTFWESSIRSLLIRQSARAAFSSSTSDAIKSYVSYIHCKKQTLSVRMHWTWWRHPLSHCNQLPVISVALIPNCVNESKRLDCHVLRGDFVWF